MFVDRSRRSFDFDSGNSYRVALRWSGGWVVDLVGPDDEPSVVPLEFGLFVLDFDVWIVLLVEDVVHLRRVAGFDEAIHIQLRLRVRLRLVLARNVAVRLLLLELLVVFKTVDLVR